MGHIWKYMVNFLIFVHVDPLGSASDLGKNSNGYVKFRQSYHPSINYTTCGGGI